jgi:2-polyprenyl-3-methyl-5-hydroxy-6-metoxy-1,4-benzoquinol methylase
VTLVAVSCPVCDGTEFIEVYPATVPASDTDPSPYFGSSRVRAGHLRIVRCRGCAMLLTNPQDDPATLARAYATGRDVAYEQEYANRCHMAVRRLALVTRYRSTPGRLLDIGCASGVFVGAAHEAGWKATGIDASAWMISRARARYPAARFRVGCAEDLSMEVGSLEVITLWDVLEHLSSPRALLTQVRDWLAPGGWLFLSVPNAASLTGRVMGKRGILLLREHLWYFSPRSLGDLLARSGLEVVATRPASVRFSLAAILDRLGQYSRRVSALCTSLSRLSGCRHVSLRFPMGEMDVVARAHRPK